MSTSAETDLQPSDDSSGVPAAGSQNGTTNGVRPADGLVSAHVGEGAVRPADGLVSAHVGEQVVRPADGLVSAHVEETVVEEDDTQE